MLKIVNRILWFVQAVGLSIPPIEIPGFPRTRRSVPRESV
jgi:hypothetical protein